VNPVPPPPPKSVNLASRSRTRNRNEFARSPRSTTGFRACYVVQGASRIGGDAEDVHPAGNHLHHDNTWIRRNAIMSKWKKSVANKPWARARRKRRQLVSTPRGADPIAETDQLALDAAVPPGRVLSRQP
jgi:hypothetical protein